jgi:uncharacterized protein YcnI
MTRWNGRRRLGAAAVLGAAAALAAAPAAYAHVEVDTGSVPGKGGNGVVRLTVPTESDTASTIGLTVTIPAGVALSSARVLPVAGWSARVETAGERVTKIVWHAQDAKKGGIGPSQFEIFTFLAGPWPADRDTVPLPTTQEYSDGSSVVWDEVAVDADSKPEHPAPVVTLGAASAGHHGHGGEAAQATSVAHVTNGGTEVAQWVLIGLAVLLAATAAARASVAAAKGR